MISSMGNHSGNHSGQKYAGKMSPGGHYAASDSQYAYRNLILEETIKEELALDSYYFSDDRIILVRIDAYTINNPVLADW